MVQIQINERVLASQKRISEWSCGTERLAIMEAYMIFSLIISKNNIEWSSSGVVLNIKPISNTSKPLYMLSIYDLYNKRLILRWKTHISINIRFLKSVQVWVLGRALEYWWADEQMKQWGGERDVCCLFLVSWSHWDLQADVFLSGCRGWTQLLFYFEWCEDKM